MNEPFPIEENFTIEWSDSKGYISDVRITKGVARYGTIQKLRNKAYRLFPWLPSWLTGWKTYRFQKQ